MTTLEKENRDVIIVGAGIAGVSLAHFLSERGVGNILVIERETQPAFHSTGRSAASLVEFDALDTIQKLKMMGARFLRNPPAGFSEHALLDPTGVLLLLREPQWSTLQSAVPALRRSGMAIELLASAEASQRVSGLLCAESFDGAALLPEDGYIDVHELLSSYIRHARRGGVEFCFGVEVLEILTERGRCCGVMTAAGALRARHVVNAAGAWVGAVAGRAGAAAIIFTPLRRSIVMFAAPEDTDTRGWPMVWSDTHAFYFRTDPAGILFCPMEEEPMAPCDPAPDDVVIAAGLERLRAVAPKLVPRALGRRWAGLRTFSPDRVPVVGEDPRLPGFFWLAGLGGCGIETSAGLGQIAADLLSSGTTERFDARLLSPARFSAA